MCEYEFHLCRLQAPEARCLVDGESWRVTIVDEWRVTGDGWRVTGDGTIQSLIVIEKKVEWRRNQDGDEVNRTRIVILVSDAS